MARKDDCDTEEQKNGEYIHIVSFDHQCVSVWSVCVSKWLPLPFLWMLLASNNEMVKRAFSWLKPVSVILRHVRSFLWPIREITFIWFPVCTYAIFVVVHFIILLFVFLFGVEEKGTFFPCIMAFYKSPRVMCVFGLWFVWQTVFCLLCDTQRIISNWLSQPHQIYFYYSNGRIKNFCMFTFTRKRKRHTPTTERTTGNTTKQISIARQLSNWTIYFFVCAQNFFV